MELLVLISFKPRIDEEQHISGTQLWLLYKKCQSCDEVTDVSNVPATGHVSDQSVNYSVEEEFDEFPEQV